ncbi:MAG: hypothetical protein KDA60_22890, partial [Planctomycetales bacterium]|nr:hypothetical protein [Planctomycetales bacterium]
MLVLTFHVYWAQVMGWIEQTESGKSRKFCWYETQGNTRRRRSVGLGRVNKKAADHAKVRLEELVACHRSQTPRSDALDQWLAGISEDLRDQLVRARLIETTVRATVALLVDAYLESRQSVAPATATRDRQVCDLVREYFRGETLLSTIGPREA